MKYEEWIKYEEARLSQPPELALLGWVEYPAEDIPIPLKLTQNEEQENAAVHLWSMIVQHLNPRKI